MQYLVKLWNYDIFNGKNIPTYESHDSHQDNNYGICCGEAIVKAKGIKLRSIQTIDKPCKDGRFLLIYEYEFIGITSVDCHEGCGSISDSSSFKIIKDGVGHPRSTFLWKVNDYDYKKPIKFKLYIKHRYKDMVNYNPDDFSLENLYKSMGIEVYDNKHKFVYYAPDYSNCTWYSKKQLKKVITKKNTILERKNIIEFKGEK